MAVKGKKLFVVSFKIASKSLSKEAREFVFERSVFAKTADEAKRLADIYVKKSVGAPWRVKEVEEIPRSLYSIVLQTTSRIENEEHR